LFTKRSGSPWITEKGVAQITKGGFGFDGTQALMVSRDASGQSFVAMNLTGQYGGQTIFTDFLIKPSAETQGGLASLYFSGSQVAFQAQAGSTKADIWASVGGPRGEEPIWVKTPGSIGLGENKISAAAFSRITVRQNFSSGLWDLSLDGKMIARDLPFEASSGHPSEIRFYASKKGETYIDNLSITEKNPLEPASEDSDGAAQEPSLEGIDPWLDLYLELTSDPEKDMFPRYPDDKKQIKRGGNKGKGGRISTSSVTVEFQVFTPLR